ncbi:MAG: hypothetical protein AB1704_06510 [Pseudomonadota bacterium]
MLIAPIHGEICQQNPTPGSPPGVFHSGGQREAIRMACAFLTGRAG